MIRHRVIFPEEVRIFCSGLAPSVKRRIRASLRLLEEDPLAGKSLERELTGFRSYAIPPYRIVYRVEPSTRIVRLVRVGRREDIYEILVQKLNSGEIREKRAIYVRK